LEIIKDRYEGIRMNRRYSMRLKDKWKNWTGFSKPIEKKASQSAPLLFQFTNSNPQFTPRRYDRLAEEAYQKNIIAYRCIRLISQNAAAVPWQLYNVEGGTKKQLYDHPIIELLKNPNPMQSKVEFLEAIFGYYLISGNSYLEAVGPVGETPHELWALRPDRLNIIPGKTGVPSVYRYSVMGENIDFPVDPLTGRSQILHLKAFHPLDDWYGMSPLEAAAYSIDQHNAAAKWNASLLQNGGRPSGALVYKPHHADGQDTLTEEQRNYIKAELEQYYQGASNAGRPLVLEGGLDWREMSLNPKDMDWAVGKEIATREIALAYHVPAQLVGVEGSLTYANFEQARLALYDDAILPLLNYLKEELNKWLLPRFGGKLCLDFDKDSIDALALRRDKIWERLNKTTFLTANEKRQMLGLDPLDSGDILEQA